MVSCGRTAAPMSRASRAAAGSELTVNIFLEGPAGKDRAVDSSEKPLQFHESLVPKRRQLHHHHSFLLTVGLLVHDGCQFGIPDAENFRVYGQPRRQAIDWF